MEDYQTTRIVDRDELDGLSLPGEVQLALDDLAGSVRERVGCGNSVVMLRRRVRIRG